MSVNVLFFGVIAARLGEHKRAVAISEGMTLSDLLVTVGCNDFKPLVLAVNQTQVKDLNRKLSSGDEVAIMPPFSGG